MAPRANHVAPRGPKGAVTIDGDHGGTGVLANAEAAQRAAVGVAARLDLDAADVGCHPQRFQGRCAVGEFHPAQCAVVGRAQSLAFAADHRLRRAVEPEHARGELDPPADRNRSAPRPGGAPPRPP